MIGPEAIEQYKAKKLAADLSAKTINNHLMVLSKCLKTAIEWGHLEKAPKIRLIKTISNRLDFLSPEESERLLSDVQEPVWHAMVLVALHTGMRLGELFALSWEDVDLERRLITVRRSLVEGVLGSPKSHRIRYIPMTERIFHLLFQKFARQGYIFHAQATTSLTHGTASAGLERLCRRTGVRQVSWHVLRHTFASQLVMRGVPLRAVQVLLGHSTVTMTEKYAHLAPSTLHEAIQVLNRPTQPENFGHWVGIEQKGVQKETTPAA